METVGIALLGLGTVGQGVVRLLESSEELVARRMGRLPVLRGILVRDMTRARVIEVPRGALTSDGTALVRDPDTSVVIEALGGIEPARSLILEALRQGKDVVTANKALLAECGRELFEAARQAGRAIAFEASVGGGIPIVQTLQVGLAANRILSLLAILNGTCNFILTAMSSQGMSYRDALKRAQELGYAEPDPTLDVDGSDTAHKLAILAQLAFGAEVATEQIPRQGIDQLQLADIMYAGELGYNVKLLAEARQTPSGLILRVAPRLVARGMPLAQVQGPYNAIRIVGDCVGDCLLYGRGAGALPTASALVSDLVDVVLGRARLTARALNLWSRGAGYQAAAAADVRSRYYLRFSIADRPGVLGSIAQVLGRHQVSIASLIQHDPGEADANEFVPLVLMTHMATEADLEAALAEIDRLPIVAQPSVRLGVADHGDAEAAGSASS